MCRSVIQSRVLHTARRCWVAAATCQPRQVIRLPPLGQTMTKPRVKMCRRGNEIPRSKLKRELYSDGRGIKCVATVLSKRTLDFERERERDLEGAKIDGDALARGVAELRERAPRATLQHLRRAYRPSCLRDSKLYIYCAQVRPTPASLPTQVAFRLYSACFVAYNGALLLSFFLFLFCSLHTLEIILGVVFCVLIPFGQFDFISESFCDF